MKILSLSQSLNRISFLKTSLLTIALTFSLPGSLPSAFASSLCRQALSGEDYRLKRQELLKTTFVPLPSELIEALKKDDRLIFKGDHIARSGTEFIASNESDWTLTPFDHKKGDVLVAFATNSAWEIAADKNVETFVLADWSANPIIAHAYIWTPFWKLAKSPTELILLSGGIIPNLENSKMSVDEALAFAYQSFLDTSRSRGDEIKKFINFLAGDPLVTDTELMVITQFMTLAIQNTYMGPSSGPFENLHPRRIGILQDLMKFRYDKEEAAALNPKTRGTDDVFNAQSVLHNLDQFAKVKKLFETNQVLYAQTAVNNPLFYQSIRTRFTKPDTQFSLSLSNIFDCGSYNCLTFGDFQNFLQETAVTLGANSTKPLVVFRTTNDQPPHGFYRYEISSPVDVPARDEVDSVALKHSPSPFGEGLPSFSDIERLLMELFKKAH